MAIKIVRLAVLHTWNSEVFGDHGLERHADGHLCGAKNMKGKPWTNEEEKELRRLVKSRVSVSLIAQTMGKTVDAVIKKCSRLGLEVVDGEKFSNPTTSRVELPTELLTVEQALLCLRGAMKGLERED